MILIITLLLLSYINVPFSDVNTSVKKPMQTKSEAIGSYTSGCIAGAKELSSNEQGLVIRLLKPGRHWGHPDLIQMLKEAGQEYWAKRKKYMIIGDLGLPKGGPIIAHHSSHQNGLDVDVWLQVIKPESKQYHLLKRDRLRPQYFINKDGFIRKDLWSEDQVELIKVFAKHKTVQKIFVNARLKQYLCQHKKRYGFKSDWLRKIRAWYWHGDHLHIRIYCPKNSPDCIPQKDPPIGEGCGQNLNWWFTEEAKPPKSKIDPYQQYLKRLNNLPGRCKKMFDIDG